MLKLLGYSIAAVAGIGAIAVAVNLASTATTVITAPGRVLQRTLQTDNIISSYEWYFETSAQFNARLGQIITHRQILSETTDAGEKSRLRIELAAMQQSCRELAERYNANSMKLNKGLFKDWRLAEALSSDACSA